MRIFEFSTQNRDDVIRLPINPSSFELSEPKLNQKITLLNIGEINLLGNRGLVTCALSSFFPSPKSPHFHRADRTPQEYIDTFFKWKNSDEPIRLIITNTYVNLSMAIEKFNYSQREGDDDIYYTIDLAEYRFLNVPSVAVASSSVSQGNGLKNRPNTAANPSEVIVKSQADTLWAMACKYYGDGTKWTVIAKANNITDPRKMYKGQVVKIP